MRGLFDKGCRRISLLGCDGPASLGPARFAVGTTRLRRADRFKQEEF